MEAETSSLELRPPPSPDAYLPKPGFPILSTTLIGLGVLLLIMVVMKWRKSAAKPSPVKLRRLAYESAVRALNQAQANSGREAATVSSLVLRRYLATVSGDPALFETHEEFISRHDALTSLPEAARHAAVAGFDRLASLKYAKEPGLEDAAPVIESSRSLLETLNRSFA